MLELPQLFVGNNNNKMLIALYSNRLHSKHYVIVTLFQSFM